MASDGGPTIHAEPHQRSEEVRALVHLAFRELEGGPKGIGELHRTIAGRALWGVQRGLGPAVRPVELAHDAIARGVYGALRGTTGLFGRAADFALKRWPLEGPPPSVTPAGSLALGAIQGLRGDALEAEGSPLAQPMAVRVQGRALPSERVALAAAFPSATPQLAVFLHGLMETERTWGLGGRPTYGERLRRELDFTPIELRYNSGLHVSDNGRKLARLLEDLVDAWPAPVEEIVLIGHSMGGLVARSACHYGEADGHLWTERVRHVFCLGAPHLGADLEKAANVLGYALGRVPETRPFARAVNRRSTGIKDLRFGSCVEEDWRDCDPDEFLRDRCSEVPFLPRASYCFIAATLRPGPLGSLFGDLLVRVPSASGRGNGRGRRIPFEVENGRELAGLTHFDLLNHPAVYEQLRTWLTHASTRPGFAAGTAACTS